MNHIHYAIILLRNQADQLPLSSFFISAFAYFRFFPLLDQVKEWKNNTRPHIKYNTYNKEWNALYIYAMNRISLQIIERSLQIQWIL